MLKYLLKADAFCAQYVTDGRFVADLSEVFDAMEASDDKELMAIVSWKWLVEMTSIRLAFEHASGPPLVNVAAMLDYMHETGRYNFVNLSRNECKKLAEVASTQDYLPFLRLVARECGDVFLSSPSEAFLTSAIKHNCFNVVKHLLEQGEAYIVPRDLFLSDASFTMQRLVVFHPSLAIETIDRAFMILEDMETKCACLCLLAKIDRMQPGDEIVNVFAEKGESSCITAVIALAYKDASLGARAIEALAKYAGTQWTFEVASRFANVISLSWLLAIEAQYKLLNALVQYKPAIAAEGYNTTLTQSFESGATQILHGNCWQPITLAIQKYSPFYNKKNDFIAYIQLLQRMGAQWPADAKQKLEDSEFANALGLVGDKRKR